MRHLSILVLLIFLIACKSREETDPQSDTAKYAMTLAYSRGEYINYYSTKSNRHGTISNCYDPCISPDGLELAYTENYESDNPNAAGSNRRIVVLNLETGEKRIIIYNSHQYYGPVWSNDGKKIAFNAFTNGVWNIVLVDTNLNNYRVLKPQSTSGYHTISWTSDDKEILTHNLDTLFIIDTSNIIREQFLVKDIINNRSKSSATVFNLTPDRKYLVFNADNNEASFCSDTNEFHDGLPNALYKYELYSKSLVKLTPDTLYCSDYEVSRDKIYFTASRKCNARKRNIYTISLEGKNLKEFLKDGKSITVEKKNGS
jgi:Tol biopolymer transport system component